MCQYAEQKGGKYVCRLLEMTVMRKRDLDCPADMLERCIELQSQRMYEVGGHYAPKEETPDKTGEN
jgi:hypothetical protein